MNNYERIKQMSLDEMAEHLELFSRACIDGALFALKTTTNHPPLDICVGHMKKWLQAESPEEESEE